MSEEPTPLDPNATEQTEIASEVPPKHGLLIYTLLRIGMVLVFWLLLALFVPMPWPISLAAAVLLSGMISLFVLNRVRDGASYSVTNYFTRMNARIDRASVEEDARLDALEAAQREQAAQAAAQDDNAQPDDNANPAPNSTP